LFTWAKSGLRVFGFSDWATPCKFNATSDGIVLHLNIDQLPNIPELENVLLDILKVITEEVNSCRLCKPPLFLTHLTFRYPSRLHVPDIRDVMHCWKNKIHL